MPDARLPRRPSVVGRVCAVAVIASSTAGAQATADPHRHVLDAAHAWITFDGDNPLSSRWGVASELHLRRADAGRAWQQLEARAGLRYYWTHAAALAAGYTFTRTWPYESEPASVAPVPEHQLWEQLQLRSAAGRVALAQRFRFEERWIGALDGAGHVASWRRANRVRTLVRATLPLQGATLEPREWYAAASSELFVNWGGNVRRNVFDQHRGALLVGRQLSRTLRVEGGYMHQLLLRADGLTVERNHTVQLGVASSAPLAAGGRRAVR